MKARTGGGGRDDSRDYGLSRSWKVHVWEEKNAMVQGVCIGRCSFIMFLVFDTHATSSDGK